MVRMSEPRSGGVVLTHQVIQGTTPFHVTVTTHHIPSLHPRPIQHMIASAGPSDVTRFLTTYLTRLYRTQSAPMTRVFVRLTTNADNFHRQFERFQLKVQEYVMVFACGEMVSSDAGNDFRARTE